MKTTITTLIIVACFNALSAFTVKYATPQGWGNSIAFQKSTIIYNKKHRVISGVLVYDTKLWPPNYLIQNKGYWFKMWEKVTFDKNGHVIQGTIRYAPSFKLPGTGKVVQFRQGTEIRFDSKGCVTYGSPIAAQKLIPTHWNGVSIWFKQYFPITFDKDGKVISGTLLYPYTFLNTRGQKVRVYGGRFVSFDLKTGRLK